MLLEALRAWLNGRRDYYTGVALYTQHNPDLNLLNVLKEGPNEFRIKRLLEELLAVYEELKQVPQDSTKLPQDANKTALDANKIAANANVTIRQTPEKYSTKTPENIPEAKAVNEELYQACKLEADNEYKKVMNTRAVLFKKAAPEGFLDVNKPDLIYDRGELAIQVVQGWKKVSELYERAEFVKIHGRLPATSIEEDGEEYEHIPDELVKLRLDNARKAYNKLKKKEPTPERIVLLQKHEKNIKKLTERWHSLQPEQ